MVEHTAVNRRVMGSSPIIPVLYGRGAYMKYISCIHDLNLPCSLETCGDWHTSALQWVDLHMRESDNSIFGNY